MAICELTLITKSGSRWAYKNCVSFNFEKEMYTPYTKATGLFYSSASSNPSVNDVKTVVLSINGAVRHIGLPDNVRIIYKNGFRLISFSSRGYTLLLGQNEPFPKINSNVNLSSLIFNNITSTHITCEVNTPVINYIYVKEKSTIWDAVTAYSIKAVSNYPFISGTNKVMVNYGSTNTFNYSDVDIIDKQYDLNTSLLLSDVNMADLEGEYTTSKTDTNATSIDIAREKYYLLDRQWLYSPETGLKAKLDYADRGIKTEAFSYIGTMGEDLMDRIVGCPISYGMRINALKIYGNSRGVFTKLICYNDKYGQNN